MSMVNSFLAEMQSRFPGRSPELKEIGIRTAMRMHFDSQSSCLYEPRRQEGSSMIYSISGEAQSSQPICSHLFVTTRTCTKLSMLLKLVKYLGKCSHVPTMAQNRRIRLHG